MKETWHVKVDTQVMSLLTIHFWSSPVCIVLLFAINLINYLRNSFGLPADMVENEIGRLLSPDLVLLLSAACVIWLLMRAVKVRKVIRRMKHVYLCIDGEMVSGVSMAEPSVSSREYQDGRPFSIHASMMKDVFSKEVQVVQKQLTPALVIKTEDDVFVMPGIALLNESKIRLLQLLEESSDKPTS